MNDLEPEDTVEDNRRMTSVLTLVAALFFACSPLVTGGFGGFAPDQFPVPQINPPAQPAGYAFAIWGVIYLWLVAGALYGMVRRDSDKGWDRMRRALLPGLAVGIIWIPVAQISAVWATILIWVMLASSVLALLRAPRTDRRPDRRTDRLWGRAPVAVLAGWLTAASCVGAALLLAGYGVLSAQAAALVMLVLAVLIALWVQGRRGDSPEYAGAVIWALVGVIVANLAGQNWAVLALAGAGIVLLVLRGRQVARRG